MSMDILIFVLIFILGSIIGSFLNVVIFRLNTGRTIVKGRSMCMTCGRKLYWYELVPIISFFMQRGRCRHCKIRISVQYPIVEILTGIIFMMLAYKFLIVSFFSLPSYIFLIVFFGIILSSFLVMVVYDIRHKIIPEKVLYVFIVFSIISLFVNTSGFGSLFIKPSLSSIIAGPLLSFPFALIWIVSRGKWMGLGDAKLVLGIGWLLGIAGALCSLILSFWFGAVISIIIMIFSRRKVGMKTEIPFAPFLFIGIVLTFFLGLDISSLSYLFFIN
jgi:leader peptidase (prepilin peptidase)/N-methyltransferase